PIHVHRINAMLLAISGEKIASPSPPQPLAKPLNPLQPLLDVRHAGGVADADVIVSAERDAGDSGDFFSFEQFGAEVAGFETSARDVREQIEGAFGINAGNAGDAVELLPGESAAFVELGQPEFQVVLWPSEGG